MTEPRIIKPIFQREPEPPATIKIVPKISESDPPKQPAPETLEKRLEREAPKVAINHLEQAIYKVVKIIDADMEQRRKQKEEQANPEMDALEHELLTLVIKKLRREVG